MTSTSPASSSIVKADQLRGARAPGPAQAAPKGSPAPSDEDSEVPQAGQSKTIRDTLEFGDGDEQKPEPESDCSRRVLAALKLYSPSGYRTWEMLKDKSVFNNFAKRCKTDEEAFEDAMPTAVHESNHAIRALSETFHLASNEVIPVPPTANYFAPKLITNYIKAKVNPHDGAEYFQTYISDPSIKASSKDRFTYLLDELNAYTNDLQVSADLAQKNVFKLQFLSGVPALMTYVVAYMTYARDHDANTWNSLNSNPEVKAGFAKIWSQAEATLRGACQNKIQHQDSAHYLRFLCDSAETQSISTVLGRQSWCPRSCQQPANEDDDAV